jgi:hypothetical protein
MADFYDPAKFGAIVAIHFIVANAVTNAANVDLTMGGNTNTLAVMPVAGSVVGISVKSTANVTAGTATFRAHLASTEFADVGYPAPVLSSAATNSNASYASIRPGALKFTAGQTVGVSYVTTTDCAPTDTNDYDAILFVQLNAV